MALSRLAAAALLASLAVSAKPVTKRIEHPEDEVEANELGLTVCSPVKHVRFHGDAAIKDITRNSKRDRVLRFKSPKVEVELFADVGMPADKSWLVPPKDVSQKSWEVVAVSCDANDRKAACSNTSRTLYFWMTTSEETLYTGDKFRTNTRTMDAASFPYAYGDNSPKAGEDWSEVKLRVRVPGYCAASYRFVYVGAQQRGAEIHSVFGDGQVDTKPCAPVRVHAVRVYLYARGFFGATKHWWEHIYVQHPEKGAFDFPYNATSRSYKEAYQAAVEGYGNYRAKRGDTDHDNAMKERKFAYRFRDGGDEHIWIRFLIKMPGRAYTNPYFSHSHIPIAGGLRYCTMMAHVHWNKDRGDGKSEEYDPIGPDVVYFVRPVKQA